MDNSKDERKKGVILKQKRIIKKLLKERKCLNDTLDLIKEEKKNIELKNLDLDKCLEEEKLRNQNLLRTGQDLESAYNQLFRKYEAQKSKSRLLYERLQTLYKLKNDAVNNLVKLSESIGALTTANQNFLQEIQIDDECEERLFQDKGNKMFSRLEKRTPQKKATVTPMIKGFPLIKPVVFLRRFPISTLSQDRNNNDGTVDVSSADQTGQSRITRVTRNTTNTAVNSGLRNGQSRSTRYRLSNRLRNNTNSNNRNVNSEFSYSLRNSQIAPLVPVIKIRLLQDTVVPNNVRNNSSKNESFNDQSASSNNVVTDNSSNDRTGNLDDPLEGPSTLYSNSSVEQQVSRRSFSEFNQRPTENSMNICSNSITDDVISEDNSIQPSIIPTTSAAMETNEDRSDNFDNTDAVLNCSNVNNREDLPFIPELRLINGEPDPGKNVNKKKKFRRKTHSDGLDSEIIRSTENNLISVTITANDFQKQSNSKQSVLVCSAHKTDDASKDNSVQPSTEIAAAVILSNHFESVMNCNDSSNIHGGCTLLSNDVNENKDSSIIPEEPATTITNGTNDESVMEQSVNNNKVTETSIQNCCDRTESETSPLNRNLVTGGEYSQEDKMKNLMEDKKISSQRKRRLLQSNVRDVKFRRLSEPACGCESEKKNSSSERRSN